MQDLKKTFSLHLQNKLRERYGKVPSCAVFARDFALLAKDVEPISIETARKWIRGKALPHATRLIKKAIKSSPNHRVEVLG